MECDAGALAQLAARVPEHGLVLPDEAALHAFAEPLHDALCAMLATGPVAVSLVGELGAGKTALVRALLERFGHRGAVRSPTYTLFETYALERARVLHVDLYRLVDPCELDHTGFGELIQEHDLLLVEWAEQGGDRLPPFELVLRLDYHADGGRLLRLETP